VRQLIAGVLVVCGAAGGATGVAAAWPDAPVPPVSDAARADGLTDVRTVVPDAIIDLRYATPDNFVGEAMYPADARCLVRESMASALKTAADTLRPGGDVLLFWDCYRPHAVQIRMYEAVSDPGWVAKPGAYAHSHEAGLSVDVTLARGGTPADMGFLGGRLEAAQGGGPEVVEERRDLVDAYEVGAIQPAGGVDTHRDQSRVAQ
jgi:zinc D-Ala-D-Ala dipeptidase